MSRIERIEKLKNAIEILKTEFVGLDKILDDLELSIRPWYVTPEIIDRPQIISLWGMTGTGKTSVVRRLVELLELGSKTLFFDCGDEGDSSRSITDKIEDYLGEDDDSGVSKSERIVFVFDEFQYARTINENGEEVNKSGLRPIWSIIDSGIINLTTNGWDTLNYVTFLEDLSGFVKLNPGIEVDECNVTNPDSVKAVLEDLGLMYFDRGVPGFMRPRRGNYTMGSVPETDYKEDEDPYRPLRIVQDDVIRILRRKLSGKKGLDYFREVLKDLIEATRLEQVVEILEKQRPYIIAPKYIDVSDSLVFILGNLDEAYHEARDLNPDIDADLFLDSTSKVTVGDIKEALKKRFRPEQIARFGNNIIKYPSLSADNFMSIISRETWRICERFKEEFGISVTIEEDFKKLLYSEGVYPVQGARPVFTTIGTILTPLLSKILIFLEDKPGKEDYEVRIGLHGETDFKKSSVRAHIDYSDALHETVSINLQLGADRNPEKRKTRVINSVHESGHAIVMSYLTGQIPLQVISVSLDHGGFCLTYDQEREGEIPSRQDIMNKVCIGLAGYEAEKLIFGSRPEMLLCGSSSDITSTWDEFVEVVYKGGYFEPYCYSALINEQSSDGIPLGFSDRDLTTEIKSEFNRLRKITQEILADNKDLIVKMSDMMADSGGLTQSTVQKLIEGNITGTLNTERLEKVKEEFGYDWYRNTLNSTR